MLHFRLFENPAPGILDCFFAIPKNKRFWIFVDFRKSQKPNSVFSFCSFKARQKNSFFFFQTRIFDFSKPPTPGSMMAPDRQNRRPAGTSLPSLILGWGGFDKNRVFMASLETGFAINTRFSRSEMHDTSFRKPEKLDFENHKKGIELDFKTKMKLFSFFKNTYFSGEKA